MSEAGVKHDDDKPRWVLMPWKQLEDVVRVLEYGASKYPSADNWKRVPDARNRYYNAAIRHLTAHWSGERYDTESGLPHLAHAAANVLFLMWFSDERGDS